MADLRLVRRPRRAHFTLAVRLGCSSAELTEAIYTLASPCVPDHSPPHSSATRREVFRFYSDDEGQIRRVRAMLLASDELLEYDVDFTDLPELG